MGRMKILTLGLTLTLGAGVLAASSARDSAPASNAERAFTCVSPITVSLSGKPVVTTPLICVPSP